MSKRLGLKLSKMIYFKVRLREVGLWLYLFASLSLNVFHTFSLAT